MSRGNSFMSFYVGMTSVVVAVVVFAIQQWLSTRQFAMIWVGLAATQVALHIWGKYVEEHYLLVSYIENNLRHAVEQNAPSLKPESFWQYEPFLARWRIHENWWGEWVMPASVVIVFAVGIFLRRAAFRQELWLILINVALVVTLLLRTYLRVHLRKSFSNRVDSSKQTA